MFVLEQSGRVNVDFLSALIGEKPEADWGNKADGSDKAGHGIIAPDSNNESCQFNGRETTYVRRCGNEDNAGKMLHALYDPGSTFDPSKRVNDIPETEVWQFSQKQGHPAPSPRVRGHLALNHRRVQNQRLSWLGNLDSNQD